MAVYSIQAGPIVNSKKAGPPHFYQVTFKSLAKLNHNVQWLLKEDVGEIYIYRER